MTCDELERALDDYQRGALSPHDASRIETHAAHCAVCERRIDAWSTQALPVLSAFAPALPPSARDAVMRAITAPRDTTVVSVRSRAARTWRGTVVLAAAAVLVLATWNRWSPPSISPATAPVNAPVATESIDENSASRSSRQLADNEARSEFAELDAAAREIETALTSSPDDAELRAYLSSVRARRDELASRVKRATL